MGTNPRRRVPRRQPRDKALAALRELAAEIVRCPPSATGVSFAPLLRDVRSIAGVELIGIHRPVPTERGWRFDFDVFDGITPEQGAKMRVGLDERPGRWTAYDPVLPEREQRNVVRTLGELPADVVARATLAEMFRRAGLPALEQLRVLICDGPKLLAWFGALRVERFSERDRELFEALMPSVHAALRADAHAREAALLRSALATSLGLLDDAAFLVDGRGHVRHANPRGAALLDRDPTTRDSLVAIARGHRPSGVLVELLEDGKSALVVARSPGPDPSSRLALARRQWGLTPRQTEVLGHVVRGRANKQIAAELGCSEVNVESHLTQIYRKAQADGRADLVARVWAL